MKKRNLAWVAVMLAVLTMFFASCKNGSDDDYVPVRNITLESDLLELGSGEETTLTATVSPKDASDKTVLWHSSDESVAYVTPINVQTATIKILDEAYTGASITITASAKSNPNASAYCTIIVKSSGGNFSISKINGTYTFDGKTLVIEYGMVRDSDGVAIGEARIDEDGKVTIIASDSNGNTITYTAQTNSDGTLDTDSVTKPDGTKVEVTVHTHTWDDGVVTKEATDTESGEITYTCTECGQKRTEAFGGNS